MPKEDLTIDELIMLEDRADAEFEGVQPSG